MALLWTNKRRVWWNVSTYSEPLIQSIPITPLLTCTLVASKEPQESAHCDFDHYPRNEMMSLSNLWKSLHQFPSYNGSACVEIKADSVIARVANIEGSQVRAEDPKC